MGRTAYTLAVILLSGVVVSGCSSSKTTAHKPGDAIAEARKYEKEFDPADFPIEPDVATEDAKVSPANDAKGTTPPPVATNEIAPGFRVQILSTSSYDEVEAGKGIAEGQFPDEWFYVVYDPPTYRLRAGDFETRHEADQFAKQLREAGYREAWIVPERVFKNPPPRPPAPEK